MRGTCTEAQFEALASLLAVLCGGDRREGGRERNGLPGWLLVCGIGAEVVVMVVIHVIILAQLGKDPFGMDGDTLDCASTDRPCFVMAPSLIFFLAPKIIKTNKQKC